MFLFFLLFFSFSVEKKYVDLPFEDDEEPIIEIEDPRVIEDDTEEVPDEILDDELVEPTPTPTPSPNQVVLKPVIPRKLGNLEIIIAGTLLFFLIFYQVRSQSIKKSVNSLTISLQNTIANNFAVSNVSFVKQSPHHFEAYLTGRTGYFGLLIQMRYRKSLDIFGFLYSEFQKKADRLVFQFIMKPFRPTPVFFHLSKDPLNFDKNLKLKSSSVAGYQCFTDLGEFKNPFVEKISTYIKDNHNSLILVEFGDRNRFETQKESEFVFQIEFNYHDGFVDQDLNDFVIELVDSFATLKISSEHLNENRKNRTVTDKNPDEKKDDPKITKQQDEKYQKKQERKEKRGFTVKYAKR